MEKEYTFSSETVKNTATPRQLAQLSGWNRYFRHRHTIKLYKNKMDSKVIKSHQCSLEKSYAVTLILNSDEGVALFRQK